MNPRLLRPTPTGFDPRRIAGLAGWWDSTDNSTITTSTGVSSWADKSGNGYTLTQGTGANQPTLSTINGKQAFDYNGSSQFLSSTAAGLVAFASGADRPPLTFFAVSVSNVTDAGRYVAAFASTVNVQPIHASMHPFTSAQWRGFYRPNAVLQTVPTSTATYSTSVAYVVSTAVGSSYVGRANGTEVINVSNDATGQIDCDRFGVGVLARGTPIGYTNGLIGDVLVYNRVLTTAEIQKVEGYLAWKWGLQAQLPYDHPYAKSFPGFGSQTVPTDADTLTYLAAVKAADGTGVEVGVANAVDAFVTGCKSDGIWDAIKASCILAGARTLAGALTSLKGDGPTNVNNNFVSGDYNRETGLVGDGSTKYLDSNRANDDDPQDDSHNAVWVATADSQANARSYIDGGGLSSGANNIGRSGTVTDLFVRNRCSATTNPAAGTATGFIGTTRSGAADFTLRVSGANSTITQASQTPDTSSITVFSRDGSLVTNARIAFYSIGESLDLEDLDTRVSALITAIGNAL
jgi:hypothetical protein